MSGCDPDPQLGSAPAYVKVLEGGVPERPWYSIDDSIEFEHPDLTSHDDEKIQMIWNEGCGPGSDRLVADGDTSMGEMGLYGPGDTVQCVFPTEEDWYNVWREAKINGENPKDFLEQPIEWTRFEVSRLIERSVHWWLEIDDPFESGGKFVTSQQSYESGGGPNSSDTGIIQALLANSTVLVAGVVAIISILFVAGRMALQRNSQPARDMMRAMITLVVVASVSLTFIKILLEAGDRFSRYFIVNALGGEDDQDACSIIDASVREIPPKFEEMNFFLFLLCAVFLIVGSIVMLMYMIGRVFVITLLSGLLPLAAASTATGAGKQWFGKQVSYLMAFIMIKPAATIVFVVAIRLGSVESGDSGLDQVTSAGFLFMGTVLLPAMTRIAFPFTAPAAGGDKAAMSLAAAPVAVGAKTVGAVAQGAVGVATKGASAATKAAVTRLRR